jgi:hypothetical protein
VRSCSTRWTVGCSLLLILWPSGVAPQSLESICSADDVDGSPPNSEYWKARHPGLVSPFLKGLEGRGEWDASVRHILQLYREDAQYFGATLGKEAEYLAALAAVETFVNRVSETLADSKAEGVPGATAFRVQEDPSGEAYTLLDQTVFVEETDSVTQMQSLCWLGHNLTRFHERLTRGARLKSEQELRARVDRWNTFNEKGLTPFPWELALNEMVGWLGTREALEPPKLQLIALRPSVGVEVNSDLEDRVNVLAIEALGFVTYVNDRAWYLGASLVWVSPSESTSGWGALVHVAPWLKGGPVWRDVDDDGERDLRWTLSIDAFDLLKGAPASLLEAAGRATSGRAGH